MGSYTLEEVIMRWGRGNLTAEQAVGQMLLILQDLSRRVGQIEREHEAARASSDQKGEQAS